MRCGTTWTQMMLGELPDVTTDFEFKWSPGYDAHPQHCVIPDETFSCKKALDDISATSAIVGSKLVFDPVPMSSDEYRKLSKTIEPDIAIIHIVRSYWDITVSFHRGFFHVLAQPGKVRDGEMFRALKDTTNAFDAYEAQPAISKVRKIPLGEAIQFLWILFQHDVCSLRLSRQNPYLRVKYRDIGQRFAELSKFAGSTADQTTLRNIVSNPPTKKLPPCDIIENRRTIKACSHLFDALRIVVFSFYDASNWFHQKISTKGI